jgi:signal transduction histidine kinase
MITLINDMLEVDRLESGKLTYNFAAIQFEELVQEMIGDLIPLATQRNIRMEFVSSGQLLPKIKIDPEKMREVLQNLIDNAIKYTRERGTIFVGVDLQGEGLHFWVKDDGIGIPDEGKDKIFARFYRADNAIHAATDGSGLGLFIAQSVVKRHGGKIWFESTLDVGSTFHVLLPFSA